MSGTTYLRCSMDIFYTLERIHIPAVFSSPLHCYFDHHLVSTYSWTLCPIAAPVLPEVSIVCCSELALLLFLQNKLFLVESVVSIKIKREINIHFVSSNWFARGKVGGTGERGETSRIVGRWLLEKWKSRDNLQPQLLAASSHKLLSGFYCVFKSKSLLFAHLKVRFY